MTKKPRRILLKTDQNDPAIKEYVAAVQKGEAMKKTKILKGQELEDYLNREDVRKAEEEYHPWVFVRGVDELKYRFQCFACKQIKDSPRSSNDIHPEGRSKLCSDCFMSLPNLEL